MALITPTPPPACAKAFSAGLPMFLYGAPGVVTKKYLGSPPQIPTPSQVGVEQRSEQVFLLSLNEAAYHTGSINPPSAGWRFFAGNQQNETVLGRMIQVPPSQTWKLISVFYGESVYQALRASLHLGALAQVAQENYELRMLAVPGLNLEAYWLVAQKAGTPDLVIPYPEGSNQLIKVLSGGPYKMVTFLALIRPLAAGLLTMSARSGA
jgi:hypothetical protein